MRRAFAPLVRVAREARSSLERDARAARGRHRRRAIESGHRARARRSRRRRRRSRRDEHHFEFRPGAGVSIEVVGDAAVRRRGVRRDHARRRGDDSWAAVGPNMAWTHGRSWISAAFGIGVYRHQGRADGSSGASRSESRRVARRARRRRARRGGRVVGKVTITEADGKPRRRRGDRLRRRLRRAGRSERHAATIAQKGRKFVPDLVAVTVGEQRRVSEPRSVPAQRVLAVARAQVRSRLVQEGRDARQGLPERRRRRRLLQHPPRDGRDDPRAAEPRAHARRRPTARSRSTACRPARGRCSRTRAARRKPVSAQVTVVAGQDAHRRISRSCAAPSPST